MIKIIFYITILGFFNLSFAQEPDSIQSITQEPDSIQSISVEKVMEKIKKNEDMVLLDVRTEEEYEGSLGHLDSSILIHIDQLTERIDELNEFKEKEIIVICQGGFRSRKGTKILLESGFNAFDMKGGMIAYRQMEEDLFTEANVDTASQCEENKGIKFNEKELEEREK